jgi:hypothetical protein
MRLFAAPLPTFNAAGQGNTKRGVNDEKLRRDLDAALAALNEETP